MHKESKSKGKLFKDALSKEKPLQVVGTINAISALLAQKAGFNAIYLSGAGVANASYGMPDLGVTNLNDVLTDVKRITDIVDIPLLVDIDTGFGSVFGIERTIREMQKAGAAAIHIEDQDTNKRCGHRPHKKITDVDNMIDRIKACSDARFEKDFVIMARTDALQSEGIDSCIDRANQYIEAGADMIFLEGAKSLDEYKKLSESINKPILANMTEFGVSPLFTKTELKKAGVSLILYPLSGFRAMNKACENAYNVIRNEESQQSLLSNMQTREELYDLINYLEYENKIDLLFNKGKEIT